MSLGPTHPAPDPYVCPVCRSAIASPQCGRCGADLRGPAGQELWALDEQLSRLWQRRQAILEVVRPPIAAGAPATDRLSTLPPPPAATPSSDRPPLPSPPEATTWPPEASVAPEPGPQTSSILLGLGVMLLVIAALVFAAVSWSRLGAAAQGGLLVGLTVAAGAGARWASRRQLTGTAEALGALTVVLAPLVAQAVRITLDLPDIDDRSWGNLAIWSWWPAAMAAIGVAAIAFGRSIGIRATRAIGIVLVQLAPAIWVALSPMPQSMMAAALALQAGIVVAVAAADEEERLAARFWLAGSAVTWVVALAVALAEAGSIGDSVADRALAVAALAACAFAAAAAAWQLESRTALADVATGAAAVATVLAFGRALGDSLPAVAWWPAMGLVGAGGLVVADVTRGIRAGAVRLVSWTTAGFAGIPVLGNTITVLVAADAVDEPWHTRVPSPVEVDALPGLDPAWVSMLTGILAVAAALAASHRRLGARQLVVGAAGLAALAATTVPALAGGSLVLVFGLTVATAVGLVGIAPLGNPRLLSAGALGVLATSLVWAQTSTTLLLVTGGVAFALGAAQAIRGIRIPDDIIAPAGAALAAVALVAEAGVAATALGADPGWAWAVASASAAVALTLLPTAALDTWPRPFARRATTAPSRSARERVLLVLGSVLLAAHAWAMFSITTEFASSVASALSAALLIGTLALATVAARTRRSSPGWWIWAITAGTEFLVFAWIRMAEADVNVWEAYTLPLAALIAAAAWLAGRSRSESLAAVPSWQLEGPALTLALGPTVLLAFDDPGMTRLVTGLVVGILALAVGADQRRRAPFDVGVAAVVVLGLHTLLPYAAEVPRWVSLGTAGTILILLGATFEQRRRDLRQVKHRYAGLR